MLPNVPRGAKQALVEKHCGTHGLGVFFQSDTTGDSVQGQLAFPSRGETQSHSCWSAQKSISSVGLALEEFSEVSHGQYNDLLVLPSWAHDRHFFLEVFLTLCRNRGQMF